MSNVRWVSLHMLRLSSRCAMEYSGMVTLFSWYSPGVISTPQRTLLINKQNRYLGVPPSHATKYLTVTVPEYYYIQQTSQKKQKKTHALNKDSLPIQKTYLIKAKINPGWRNPHILPNHTLKAPALNSFEFSSMYSRSKYRTSAISTKEKSLVYVICM